VSGWTGSVVLVLATSTGGIGTHVADLARGLVAGGATVTVCGPSATAERFDFARTGATFVPVEISASPQPSDARAVSALRRAIDGAPPPRSRSGPYPAPWRSRPQAVPDVVHAHGLRAGLVAALAVRSARSSPVRSSPRRGRGGRWPLVVTLHNAVLARGLRGGASRLVERVVARSADVVLGASSDLVARAAAMGAADARLCPVAAPALPPPGRDRAAVRAELGVPEAVPLVLSVGRLHPQKGYDVLVAAAARWRDRNPRPQVLIAGGGPSYLDLAARISAERAPVTLLGHRHDVADLLAAADVAVVTSVWEARQLFAQEALQAGVPLVATAVGGLPELVGDAAVLVGPGDVQAVDAAVQRLLDEPATRAAYAARGTAQAATWPTPAQSLSQVQDVYAELVRVPAAEA
jgi:glycosyltransferase involved in cell wall biosynthesis